MKKCNTCGADIVEGSKFCTNCGASIDTAVNSTASVQNGAPLNNAPSTEESDPKVTNVREYNYSQPAPYVPVDNGCQPNAAAPQANVYSQAVADSSVREAQQINNVTQAQTPDFSQQAPNFNQQAPGFGQQAPNFNQQAPGFSQQAPAYGQQTPAYGQQAPNFNQQAPGFGQQAPNFNQQAPNFNQQTPNFNQQAPGFGQQAPNFNQQVPNFGQQNPGYTPKKKSNVGLIIAAVVGLIAIITVVCLFLFGPMGTKPYEQPIKKVEKALNEGKISDALDAFPADSSKISSMLDMYGSYSLPEDSKFSFDIGKGTKLSEDELNEYKEDFESDFGDYGKNITEGYSVATTLSYSYKGADFSYKVNFIICKSSGKWYIFDVKEK